jgi:hypothetical protein
MGVSIFIFFVSTSRSSGADRFSVRFDDFDA